MISKWRCRLFITQRYCEYTIRIVINGLVYFLLKFSFEFRNIGLITVYSRYQLGFGYDSTVFHGPLQIMNDNPAAIQA